MLSLRKLTIRSRMYCSSVKNLEAQINHLTIDMHKMQMTQMDISKIKSRLDTLTTDIKHINYVYIMFNLFRYWHLCHEGLNNN